MGWYCHAPCYHSGRKKEKKVEVQGMLGWIFLVVVLCVSFTLC